MGEQPVEDEVERALGSMRAGFLAGSDQITTGVASLEEHLDEAPLEEREAVRNAVAQIVAAHERLKLKIEHLPAPSWDQFKVMVGVVKVQQTLLDQLGHLVQAHVLPRQVQNLSITPFPVERFPAERAQSFPAEPAPAYEPPLPQSLRPRPPRPPRREVSVRADDSDPERQPLLPLSRERVGAAFSGLAAMVVAGVVLSLIPRQLELQEVAAMFVEMVRPAGGNAPSRGPDTTAEKEPTPAAAEPPPAEPAPPRIAVATRSDQKRAPAPPPPVVAVRADPPPAAAPDRRRPAPPSPDVVVPADPPATAEPEAKEKRSAAVTEPAAPPAKAAGKQFVPVVFTHKDRATAMQALADLKQQYPNLLIGRQGEVLPVNLGKKGIWHRLVLLPPAPRPEATTLCNQLMAKGYDRCWVKAY